MKFIVSSFFYLVFVSNSLFSLGTYSEGWRLAKILQFESRGLIFESFEGTMEVVSFDKKENCEEEKDLCYTATKEIKPFSVRPENQEVVKLLSNSINQEVLLKFKIHRITPLSLSSDNEILEATKQKPELPTGLAEKKIVKKTGSKRNFSTFGKILRLEYEGTFIGTYEGLYLDEKRNKVHPFSVTNSEMAEFAWKTMVSSKSYHLGISVAYATGFRKSNYDLFEINYNEPAGASSPLEKN
jgi:hypothetical protein